MFLVLCLGVMFGCSQPESTSPQADELLVVTPAESSENVAASEADTAYPVNASQAADDDAYPVPIVDGASDSPPNPVVDLPQPDAQRATIGGVLIRDIEDSDQFAPLLPSQFILASLEYDASGNPAFLKYDESSVRAEMFDTGVFLFQAVEPGQYGLIVNLGFTEFPVLDGGSYRLVTVEPGDALDLGQVFVQLP